MALKRPWYGRLLTACTIALVALTAAACGGSADEIAKNSDGDLVVKVGLIPITGAAGFEIAESEGFFKDEGLASEPVNLRTPADGVPNLLNGKTNLGALNVGNLAQATSEGVDLKIIGTTYYANDDMSIFTMKDSGIEEPRDLEGKKIGLVQLKNSNHAALLDWLEQRDVDTKKIEFVLVPVTDMPAALRSGQVDAGQVLYPLAQTMVKETNAIVPNLLESLGERPVQGYTIVSGAFAKKHPDVVVKMQAALEKANDLLVRDPELMITAVNTLTDVPVDLLRASKLPAFGNDLKLESSQKQVDLMVKHGFLSESVDLSTLVFKK